MKYQPPQAIDIMLTSRCNMICPFCFGPQLNKGDIDLSNAMILIEELHKSGVKTIIFSGGEPSLHDKIHIIIKAAKTYGFKTVLSTNGYIYSLRLRDEILKNLDWISIPIDGFDYKSMHNMRKLKLVEYKNIINLLKYIKNTFPTLKIKIGTVVSKININSLKEIVASSPVIPNKWKLYQISLGPRNADYFHQVQVEDSDFKIAAHSLCEAFQDIEFTFHTISERQGKHIICDPDGSAIVIDSQNEKIIGNFFNNYESTMSSANKHANFELLHNNIENTYS